MITAQRALWKDRMAGKRLRVGHVISRHRLSLGAASRPVLIFTLAQGHIRPCTWAHSFVALPDRLEPISRHLGFEAAELLEYRQSHPDHTLSWLDSAFMLQLSLDQILRLLPEWLGCSVADLGELQEIDAAALIRHRLNGDFPQLEALLAISGSYYLFHQELQALLNVPRLHSS